MGPGELQERDPYTTRNFFFSLTEGILLHYEGIHDEQVYMSKRSCFFEEEVW